MEGEPRSTTIKIDLDTNIFIAVKNQEAEHEFCERILDAIDMGRIEAIVSTIVVAEVIVGFYSNNEELDADRFSDHSLLKYNIQPVTLEIADLGAKIRATGLRLPDALIVATAIQTQSSLITMDDSVRYPHLEIVTPERFIDRL